MPSRATANTVIVRRQCDPHWILRHQHIYKPVQMAYVTSQTKKGKLLLQVSQSVTINPRCTIGSQSPFSQLLRVVSIAFIIGTISMTKQSCAVLINLTNLIVTYLVFSRCCFSGTENKCFKCTSGLMQIASSFQMTFESNWLKRLAPVFQPMRSKTNTNHTMYMSFLPAL